MTSLKPPRGIKTYSINLMDSPFSPLCTVSNISKKIALMEKPQNFLDLTGTDPVQPKNFQKMKQAQVSEQLKTQPSRTETTTLKIQPLQMQKLKLK